MRTIVHALREKSVLQMSCGAADGAGAESAEDHEWAGDCSAIAGEGGVATAGGATVLDSVGSLTRRRASSIKLMNTPPYAYEIEVRMLAYGLLRSSDLSGQFLVTTPDDCGINAFDAKHITREQAPITDEIDQPGNASGSIVDFLESIRRPFE